MGGYCISFKIQWIFPENNDFTHIFIEKWISPRCRMRLYVIGVRCDLVGYVVFSSMICFLRNRLQKVHEYVGISDVVRYLDKFGYVKCVEPSPVIKDPPIN